jgi:nucleoid DNA-binding protein
MAKTLRELATDLSNAYELSKTQARVHVNWLAEYIKAELKKNKEFNLWGLGKIVVVNTKARKGISPATGKPITIPATKKIKFRPSKALKIEINKKK